MTLITCSSWHLGRACTSSGWGRARLAASITHQDSDPATEQFMILSLRNVIVWPPAGILWVVYRQEMQWEDWFCPEKCPQSRARQEPFSYWSTCHLYLFCLKKKKNNLKANRSRKKLTGTGTGIHTFLWRIWSANRLILRSERKQWSSLTIMSY